MTKTGDTAAPPAAQDENLEESSTSNEAVAEIDSSAGEGSQPEGAKAPSARERWKEKFTTKADAPEKAEEVENTPAADGESAEATEETSETPVDEEAPAEEPAEAVKPSKHTDDDLAKAMKPETAKRFKEILDERKADRAELQRLVPLAKIGERVSKVLKDNDIPPDHFESWTQLGVDVHKGNPETPIHLFNMAMGLAQALGVELPLPKPRPPVTAHPGYVTLQKRFNAQIRAGNMTQEDADAGLEELAKTLEPAADDAAPPAGAQRRAAAPAERQAPAQRGTAVSIFRDPAPAPEVQQVLGELEARDKAAAELHKSNWPALKAATFKRVATQKANAEKLGRPIPVAAYPALFDAALDAEVAAMRAKTPVKPKVPPVTKPTTNGAANTGKPKSGKDRARALLIKR